MPELQIQTSGLGRQIATKPLYRGVFQQPQRFNLKRICIVVTFAFETRGEHARFKRNRGGDLGHAVGRRHAPAIIISCTRAGQRLERRVNTQHGAAQREQRILRERTAERDVATTVLRLHLIEPGQRSRVNRASVAVQKLPTLRHRVARHQTLKTRQIHGKPVVRDWPRGQPNVVRKFVNFAIQRVNL